MESFVLAALDVFRAKDEENNAIIIGRGKGKAMVGNAVYLSSPGTDDAGTFLSVIKQIQVTDGKNWAHVDEAENCIMMLEIDRGISFAPKRGTVVYTREATVKEVNDAYIAGLGDAYIIRQNLEISDAEFARMSIADMQEIWRMFNWYHSEQITDEPEDVKKSNREKLDKLCAALCKKILEADAIYCVYSKATGDPYLFSRTVKQENGFLCTPPNIRIIPKAYKEICESQLATDIFELKLIENGEDKKGIKEFFGDCFYANGAQGVEVVSEKTAIGCMALVAPPNFEKVPIQNRPVLNPNVERWLLLMNQMGKPENDDQKTIYGLYFGFAAKAITSARFLVPMKWDGDAPKPDESGNIKMEKDKKFGIVTQQGRDARPAARLYTDWKHLRDAYNDDWSAMVQTVDGLIESMDVVLNVSPATKGGLYLDKSTYEDIKRRASEMQS